MSYRTLIGKPGPSITLINHTGDPFTIAPGQKGIPIALFFYPKSGSFGCTKEACQFRDAIAEKDTFRPTKAEIIGISADPVDKQKLFAEKQHLTYPVLSDEKGEALKAFGVGRGLLGFTDVARVTFIIDRKGIIRDALDATMNYGAHSKFVARWLDKLQLEDAAEATAAINEIAAESQRNVATENLTKAAAS